MQGLPWRGVAYQLNTGGIMVKKSTSNQAREQVAILKPINRKRLLLTIQGTSILVMHKWSEKALTQIREKKAGRKTKTRDICDPQQEGHNAAYYTEKGEFGIPVGAVKKAIIGAAHNDLGIAKTLVKKALFLHCEDSSRNLVLRCGDPKIREDYVRVSSGGTDLRYRPEFPKGWEVDLDIEYDADLLTPDDIVNLVERAGFGIGIGEGRPEKSGADDWGRFQVKNKQ